MEEENQKDQNGGGSTVLRMIWNRWVSRDKGRKQKTELHGLSCWLRYWLNFNDHMPMMKIILCCVRNIIWVYGVNQWSLMFQNPRCTVCSKTTKGMYVTSPSAENVYWFLNSSDNAQSQKLKTIKYTVFGRNP